MYLNFKVNKSKVKAVSVGPEGKWLKVAEIGMNQVLLLKFIFFLPKKVGQMVLRPLEKNTEFINHTLTKIKVISCFSILRIVISSLQRH